MGKKGLKRKTRWRPLSISECTIVDDTNTSSLASITNSTTETNIEEDDTIYKYSVKNSSYLRRRPFTSSYSPSSTNNRTTDYRNNYNNNSNSNYYYRNISNKHNNNINNNNNNNNTISSSSTNPLYSSSSSSSTTATAATATTPGNTTSTRYSYRRRPFSTSNHYNHHHQHQQNDSFNSNHKYNYSSRLIGNGGSAGIGNGGSGGGGGGRSINHRIYHRTISEPSDKENSCISSSSKPQLNEDEYTRITTPRQDVIFKKSYLNQPKRYLSSTDTNTTSSAAASVVSTEESISATSVPSLSPEQCSSMTDSIDPEQAFMYSYFDQNGVFYVNPFLPNGFDQYGQMFMLPYGYTPYMFPQDISSPLVNGGDTTEESQISDETNKNKSDLKDSNNEVINNNNNEKEEEKEENNNTENKIIIKNNNNNDKDKNLLSESCDSIQKTIRIQQNITNNDKLNLNNNNNNDNNNDDNENDNAMSNTTTTTTTIKTINTSISDNKNDDKNENDVEQNDNNDEKEETKTTADGIVITDVDGNTKSLPSSSSSLSESSLSPSSSLSASSSSSSSTSSSSFSSSNIDMEKNEECKNDNNNKIECNENNDNNNNNNNDNGAKINNPNSNNNINKIDQNNKNNNEKSIDDHNHTKNYIKEAEIIPPCEPNDYYNYGYHQFYPHPIFYSYMYGQPFIPIFTKEYQNSADLYDGDDRNNGAKRRKRMKLDENSTDVTTTDYSEDEDNGGGDYTEDDDDDITETPEINAADVNESSAACEICDSLKENRLANNDEKDGTERIGLNTNVEEFVPKANKPHLNVHVKEFHPRRYKLKQRNVPNETEKIESTTLTVDKYENIVVETVTQISKMSDGKTKSGKVESQSESRVLIEEKNDKIGSSCSQTAVVTSESLVASSSTAHSTAQQKEEKLKIAPASSSPPSTEQSLVKDRKLPSKTQSTDKPIVTLAEKIKRTLSEESKTKIQNQNVKPIASVPKPVTSLKSNSEPPKTKRIERKINPLKNSKNINSGKLEQPPQPQRKKQSQPQSRKNESQDPKMTESHKVATETIKSVPTYAQMLNNDTKNNTKINKRNPAIEKSTKELPIESPSQQQQQDNKQNSVQPNNHKTAENVSAQVWVTVKSKGKRNKQIKEVVTAFEDEESILDENNRVTVTVHEKMNEVNEVKAETVPVPKENANNSDIKDTSSKNIEPEDSKVSITEEETSLIKVADKNDVNPTVSNKKKSSKSKNKKSRKSSSVLNKKMKGFELKESKFEIGKKKQTEKESQSVSLPLFEESQDNVDAVNVDVETLLESTPKDLEEDLTLTHLYGLDKKNPFSRTFASSSLEMMNGYDYKFYKGASILKEEEEMVLNVIKSLSHNQKKVSSIVSTTDDNQSESNQAQDTKEMETEKIELHQEIKNEIAINENTKDEPNVTEDIQLESEISTESIIENPVEDQLLEIETPAESHVSTSNLVNDEEVIEVEENLNQSSSHCSDNREDIISESSVSSDSSESDQMNETTNISEDVCEQSEIVSQQQEQQEQQNQLENSIKDSQDIPIETKSCIINEADHLLCNGTLEVITNGNITNGHCDSISPDSGDNSESFRFDVNEDKKEILNKTSIIEKDEYNRIESKIEVTKIIPENCTVLNGELTEQTNITKEVKCMENNDAEKMPNGIYKKTENENVSDIETISCKKDDPKDDFYKLLKVDNTVSTSIADQLKTIEDQLKNLERIASVTSLNGSRTDISSTCTSDNETASNLEKNHKNATLKCFKNSQTAENFRNDKITISSNSSIPSDRNESTKSVFNGNSIAHRDSLNSSPEREITIRNQSTSDNTNDHSCNINVVDKDNNNSSSNSTKNVILVPNNDDHVLNGCEHTQLLLIDNEFETLNHHIQKDDKKKDSSPDPIIIQTANKTSPIDRIRSNSLEYCCNQGNDQQNNCNDSNEIPSSMLCGNNLKAISDSSINATDSLCKYPLTNAVRKWLKDNTKDEIPEPILRIPDDPTLSTRIKSTLVEQYDHSYDDSGSELDDDQQKEQEQHKATAISATETVATTSEEVDEENVKRYEINNYPLNHSKNSISNPSHVSSVKKNDHQKINRHFRINDNLNHNLNNDEIDSDYNSDNQQQHSNQMQFNIKNKSKSQSHSQYKRFDFDDNTCERVASLLMSGTTTTIITTEDEDESEQEQYMKMNHNNDNNINLNKIHNLRNDIITIPPISRNQQQQQQLIIQQQILESQKNSINSNNDLLDYWDDEFIQNPKKWLNTTATTNICSNNNNIRRSSSNEFNNNNLILNDTCGVHKSNICNTQNERIKQKNLEKKKRKRKTKRKSKTSSTESPSSGIGTVTPTTTTTTLTTNTSLSSSSPLTLSRSLSARSSTTTLSIDEIELIPYDSVYGKTIDYKRLLSNHNNNNNNNNNDNNNLELLSNAYINNNLNLNLNYKNFKMNHLRTISNYNNNKRNLIIDMKQQQQQQNDHNNESLNNNNDHTIIHDLTNNHNNFYNDHIKFSGNNIASNMLNNNINCLKPPEVCCILM